MFYSREQTKGKQIVKAIIRIEFDGPTKVSHCSGKIALPTLDWLLKGPA
jgi:hypothetical protein